MSEHVSRAEFNELKGQLDLVCQHLGLDFGGLVTEGTGRRRAEPVVSDDFNGFEEDESFNLGSYSAPAQPEEDSEKDEDEGWESINDDELEHGFSTDEADEEDSETEESSGDTDDEPVEEGSFVEEEDAADETVKAAPATGGLPTSLHFANPVVKDEDAFDYADDEDEVVGEEEEEESHPYDETPDYQVEEVSESTPDVLTRIFDESNALTAHDIAAKQFTEIKKTLFTSPYDEDEVDEVLDEYLEILQDRNVSESKYATALLKIREVKFPESAEGYKKAEVDGFLDQIANELQRRINVFS